MATLLYGTMQATSSRPEIMKKNRFWRQKVNFRKIWLIYITLKLFDASRFVFVLLKRVKQQLLLPGILKTKISIDPSMWAKICDFGHMGQVETVTWYWVKKMEYFEDRLKMACICLNRHFKTEFQWNTNHLKPKGHEIIVFDPWVKVHNNIL